MPNAKQQITQDGSPFWSSALFGSIFGIFFAAVWAWLRGEDNIPVLFFILVPVGTGLVSGVSGAVSGYIDHALARRGLESEWQRRLLSFLVVASIVFSVFILAGRRFVDASPVVPVVAWGGPIIGILFGATVAIMDYRSWLVRTKMEDLERENRYLAEIAKRDEALQEVSRSLILTEERSRMAKELHDSISQGLHGLGYGLQALQSRLERNQAVEEILEHLDSTLRSTQQELRTVIQELQPSAVEEHGLQEAFELYGQRFQGHYAQQRLTMEVQYSGGLLAAQEAAAYRVLQEALTNAGRHAGPCEVRVRLAGNDGSVLLEIADDGCGFRERGEETPLGGRGLRNMEERVRQTGGQWKLASQPSGGTKISVRWPQTGE